MARWKLMSAHYLWTDPPVEWEQKETDQLTGRQARKVFQVPRYLDPKDPSDWTSRDDQEICVSDGHNPERRDIIFRGDPTPEMEPLDDEARKISDGLRPNWEHPIEDLAEVVEQPQQRRANPTRRSVAPGIQRRF